MSRTAILRRQHDAAVAIVTAIAGLTKAMGDAPSREQATEITDLLAKLTGLLRIHFAQEDKSLYPSLMASGQGGVAATARRFFEEMGQIGPVFAAFSDKWQSSSSILADPAGFRAESSGLWAALGDRITRENEELYPLADALTDDSTGANAA